MATRLYTSWNDPVFPALGFTAAVRGTWSSSSVGNMQMMWTDKSHVQDTGTAMQTITETNATNPWTQLARPFVSPRLQAQTIDGTIQLGLGANEISSDANASIRLHVYVLAPNNTVRGTLLNNYTDPAELGTNATADGVSLASAQTLSSVIAEAGDRIVVEVGFSFGNSLTSTQRVEFTFGSDPADPDLIPGGNANNSSMWIEFSDTITFLSPEAIVSQEVVEVLTNPASPAGRVSQVALEYLANRPAPAARVSQEAVEVLLNPGNPAGRISQIAIEVLVSPIVPITQFHKATIIVTS